MKVLFSLCFLLLLSNTLCVSFLEKEEKDKTVVFNKDEWVQRLMYLKSKPTKFDSTFPKNLLYYDGQTWYCDGKNIKLKNRCWITFGSF